MLEFKGLVIYAGDRVLIKTDMDGSPPNILDVSAMDVEEINQALGMVFRSLRRQILDRMMTNGAPPPAESSG